MQVVGETLGKLRCETGVVQRVSNPRAGVIVPIVLRLGKAVNVVVGGAAETAVKVGKDEAPLASCLRFPQHHVVAPAAVARPDFRRPIIGKILHVDLGGNRVEIGLDAEVLIEQPVHHPIRRIRALFHVAVVGDQVESVRLYPMVLLHKLLVDAGTDVVDAHVFAVDENDARSESLVIDVDVFLGQVLAQRVAHQRVRPIRAAGSQHEVVKFGSVAVVEQRVVKAPAAVGATKVNSEHLLREDPAVLAVDFDASALVEHRFVVAVVFEKFHVQRPFPLRLEALHVDTGVRVPEIVGIGHEGEHRERPLFEGGVEKVTVGHRRSGDVSVFEDPGPEERGCINGERRRVQGVVRCRFSAVCGVADGTAEGGQFHCERRVVKAAFGREIRDALGDA